MKKGMSQTIWIVITIVVALIVALILIKMFMNTSNKTQEGTNENIDSGLDVIKINTCKSTCETFKRVSSEDSVWGTDVGEGCIELGVTCDE